MISKDITKQRGSLSACSLDFEKFMKASSLRDCLTSLGADPDFRQVEYIETVFGHDDYLDKICQSICVDLKYDKIKTEEQDDACPSNADGLMYPSHCEDGWLECDSIKNGCANSNFIGFFCKGKY